jgi:hypothetical protein
MGPITITLVMHLVMAFIESLQHDKAQNDALFRTVWRLQQSTWYHISWKIESIECSSLGLVYTWGLGCDQLGHSLAASSSESESSKFLSNAQIVDGLLPENGGGKSLSDSLFQPPTLVIFRRLFQTIDEDCHLFLNVSYSIQSW